jgi:hypothetical protein
MSTEVLEQKIHELTRRVERLEAKQRPAAKQTWREAFGTMPDDEISREAARLGEEWRRSEGMSSPD